MCDNLLIFLQLFAKEKQGYRTAANTLIFIAGCFLDVFSQLSAATMPFFIDVELSEQG
ncbi:MAG: hypothetical protein OFPI_35780 [Osedax symbiont Rs2]|nr:MAG: hypothetical protein OFPI_35780 [Osedax symbiont Rs2]